jgi:NitT/TauT family transport system ATP-binding protein
MVHESILKLRSVSKRFEKSILIALQDVNLEVGTQEFLCILGPNGCGKTTLLNLIAGFKPYFPPSEGEILVNGSSVEGPGSDRTMVFQDGSLFPWLNVQDNIEFGLRIKGVPKEERRKRSDYYLKMMGLEDFRSEYPFRLSGGMKQKTELARALIMKPKILLLDEPFAQVDALTRQNLQEELLMIKDIEKPTAILVSHNTQEAVFLGDRVCVMTGRPGKIKEEIDVKLPKLRKWRYIIHNEEFIGLNNHLAHLVHEGDSKIGGTKE